MNVADAKTHRELRAALKTMEHDRDRQKEQKEAHKRKIDKLEKENGAQKALIKKYEHELGVLPPPRPDGRPTVTINGYVFPNVPQDTKWWLELGSLIILSGW